MGLWDIGINGLTLLFYPFISYLTLKDMHTDRYHYQLGTDVSKKLSKYLSAWCNHVLKIWGCELPLPFKSLLKLETPRASKTIQNNRRHTP